MKQILTLLSLLTIAISNAQTVVFQLKKAFERLEKEQNIEYHFSLMTKYVFDNFETIISRQYNL